VMKVICFVALLATVLSGAYGFSSNRVQDIQARGDLRCTMSPANTLFTDSSGEDPPPSDADGFDALYCASFAAALFDESTFAGAYNRVDFSSVTSDNRFPFLQENEDQYDIIVRTTTNTMSRDIFSNATFARSNFYDGQGFLTRVADGWECFSGCAGKALSEQGARICVTSGTTTATNLLVANSNGNAIPIDFDEEGEAAQNFQDGQCDAFTSDKSTLAAFANPATDEILAQSVSREPLGAAVLDRVGDGFAELIHWAMNAVVLGEMCGISSSGAGPTTSWPECDNLLDLSGSGLTASPDGISSTAFNSMLRAIGNYDDIYNAGAGGEFAVRLPRSSNFQNQLYLDLLSNSFNNGGLIYPEVFHWTASSGYTVSTESIIPLIRNGAQKLRCGVGADHPAMATELDSNPSGFEVDLCRAVAGAILAVRLECYNDFSSHDFCEENSILDRFNVQQIDSRIEYVTVTEDDKFDKLLGANPEIDVLFARTANTIERDVKFQMDFSRPYFYDELRELHRPAGTSSATCVRGNTLMEFYARSLYGSIVECSSLDDCVSRLNADECSTYVDQGNVVYTLATTSAGLEVTTSVSPLARFPIAAGTRQGDIDMSHLVEWVVNGLVLAELHNVVDPVSDGFDCRNRDLRGEDLDEKCRLHTKNNGLAEVRSEFMVGALQLVGNYEAVWERHFDSIIPSRGGNQLACQSCRGQLYAPPWTGVDLEFLGSAPVLAPTIGVTVVMAIWALFF